MLVLTRKLNEQIKIGRDITITVVRLKGNVVRLGIDAPKNLRIARSEIFGKLFAGATESQPEPGGPSTTALRAAGAAGEDWPAASKNTDSAVDSSKETHPLAVGPRSVSLAVRGTGPRQAPLAGLVRRRHPMM